MSDNLRPPEEKQPENNPQIEKDFPVTCTFCGKEIGRIAFKNISGVCEDCKKKLADGQIGK